MSPPVTIAEGSLRSTPFAHVLVSALKKSLSGTVAVWPDDERKGQDRIRFERGRIVCARLLETSESLERGLLPIFSRLGPFAVYEGDFVGTADRVLLGPVEVFPLLAAGVRGGARDEVVDPLLAKFGMNPVRLTANFDPRGFALTSKELTSVEAIRGPALTIEEHLRRSADPKTTRRILYLLAITSQIERDGSGDTLSGRLTLDSVPGMRPNVAVRASLPPGLDAATRSSRPPMPRADRRKAKAYSAPEPPPTPPAGLTPELLARWDDLADRVVRSDEQTHFELLGIADSAGASEGRTAYFDLVKRVHPDRLPPELAPLRSYVERLFQQITEARETVEDDEKRIAYVRNVRNGGGTPASDRKLMGAVAAAHELEKATVLANMGKWPEVLDALDDAKVFDPSQLDIYALEAWALFNLLGKERAATTEAILALTERVLVDPAGMNHERARYTRALTLKKLGKEPEAIELLRKILERNPKHLEAAREVRLFEMRARETAKQATERASKLPEGTGFLSKLFGKKE